MGHMKNNNDNEGDFDRPNLSENWKKHHNNNQNNNDYSDSSEDPLSPSREEINEQKYRDAFTEDLEDSFGSSSSNNNDRNNRNNDDDKEVGHDKHGVSVDSSQDNDEDKYKMFNGFKFRYGPNNSNDNNDDDTSNSKEENSNSFDNNDDDGDNQKKKKKKKKKKIFPEDTDSYSDSSSSSKPKPLNSSPEGGANFGVSDFTNGGSNNNRLGSSSSSTGNSNSGATTGDNSGETGHKIKQGEKEEGGTAPSPFEPEEKLSYHPTKLPSYPSQQQRSNSHYNNNNNNNNNNEEDKSENRGKMMMHSEDSPYNHEIKELYSNQQQEEQEQLHDKGEGRDFTNNNKPSTSITLNNYNNDDIDDIEAFNNNLQGHRHHHVKGISDNHATFRIHSKKDIQQQMMLSKKSDSGDQQ